jgi:hypothetical protein
MQFISAGQDTLKSIFANTTYKSTPGRFGCLFRILVSVQERAV